MLFTCFIFRVILGIETSCDDTAAALIDLNGTVLSHVKASNLESHKQWGGIVPSLAACDHLKLLPPVVRQVFEKAGHKPNQLIGVAATCGPGLIGSLLVGSTFGKAMAMGLEVPFLPINHLEAHALMPLYETNIDFPYLLLLISGGHSQFFLVRSLGDYFLLGQSLDDALGEAFDKVARMLGLDYPGGPALEALAKSGDPARSQLPRPMYGRPGCDLSFSGLKTAVLRLTQKENMDCVETRSDIAASFQNTICQTLQNRLEAAVKMARQKTPDLKNVVISGGVAANAAIRKELEEACAQLDLTLSAPKPELCTDNGIMVAFAAYLHYKQGWRPNIHFKPRARWPLAAL